MHAELYINLLFLIPSVQNEGREQMRYILRFHPDIKPYPLSDLPGLARRTSFDHCKHILKLFHVM